MAKTYSVITPSIMLAPNTTMLCITSSGASKIKIHKIAVLNPHVEAYLPESVIFDFFKISACVGGTAVLPVAYDTSSTSSGTINDLSVKTLPTSVTTTGSSFWRGVYKNSGAALPTSIWAVGGDGGESTIAINANEGLAITNISLVDPKTHIQFLLEISVV